MIVSVPIIHGSGSHGKPAIPSPDIFYMSSSDGHLPEICLIESIVEDRVPIEKMSKWFASNLSSQLHNFNDYINESDI